MSSRPLIPADLPAPPAARPLTASPRGTLLPRRSLRRADALGAVFLGSLAWLLFDLGRPPFTPAGVPLVLSGAMFIDWVSKKDKQLGPRWIWWLVLLAVIASGVLFAANTYSAFFYTRLMGILFLGVCLPLQGLLTSLRRLRWWLYAMILIAFYVGGWATTHGGYGPASSAGQDENYVAALMTLGAALAYFVLFSEKRLWLRVILGVAICTFIAAMALAENASRGGFLALVAVALCCLWRSPKKVMGLSIIAAATGVLFLVAGDGFWKEIDSTGDYQDGTGDVRLELWKTGLRMWKANPALGVGAGNFRWVIEAYQTPEQFQKFGRGLGGSIIAHSSHVEMLAELGSAGAVAMIVLTWSTWQGLGKVRPPRRKPGEPPLHPDLVQLGQYADAVRCAILAMLVNGTFLSLFYYSHIWVLIAAGTAMPYVHARILEREATLAGNVPPPVIMTKNTRAARQKPLPLRRDVSRRRQG